MHHQVEHKSSDHRSEFLSVRLAAQEFAIDIKSIREIRGWLASTRLPFAPSFIKGMINLRGSVLIVLDLAQRLGLDAVEPDAGSVIVVVECHNRTVGLLVDAVCDIITVADNMRQTTPETGSDIPKSFVEELVMMDNRIISILSLPILIPEEKIQKMAEMAAE